MKNWDKILNDTYNRLYKLSEPSANFNELVESATINSYGQKEIPFNRYEIDIPTYEDVLEKIIKKYRLNEIESKQLKNTIALGCSPRFKKINEKYVI
jgi:hypothetical protein